MKRKFVSFIMTFVLLVSVVSPSAFATSVSANIETNGNGSAQSVIAYLEENGIRVDTTDTVTVQKLTAKTPAAESRGDATEEAYAVIVRHDDANSGADIILSIGTQKSSAQTRAGHTIYFPPASWDDRLTIRGTAVYDYFLDGMGIFGYYRPIGTYFTYTKGTANTVSYISVRYDCQGAVHNYPSFSDTGYDDVYMCAATASYPVQSTMYSNTSYYPSDKCIRIAGFGAGNYLSFDFTVDGRTDGYTVMFP